MASVSLQAGRIQFRHPLVRDDDDHGIIVKKRIGKLPKLEQEQVRIDLEKLISKKPRLRSEVPDKDDIGDIAKDIYFDPLAQMTADSEILLRFAKLGAKHRAKGEQIMRFLRSKGLENAPCIPFDLLEEFIDGLVNEGVELAASLNTAQQTIEEKDNIIEGLEKATGAQRAEQKAITLEECLAHFQEHVSCKSAKARRKLLYRVGVVLRSLGLTTKHSSITKKAVEEAIKNSRPPSETEALYRARDIRRFFRLLACPVSSDGLGLVNPTEGFKSGSQASLQRKRRQRGEVEVLDPHSLLKLKSMSVYWKALIALLGYGGLRLAEAAALEWDRLNFKKGLVYVRPTATYPELKSIMSARDVKPFPNVWKYLRDYMKGARHKELVFDRVGKAGPTWFRVEWFALKEELSLARIFKTTPAGLEDEYRKAVSTVQKTKRGEQTITDWRFDNVAYRLVQTDRGVRLYKGEPTATALSGALIAAIGDVVGMPCKLRDGRTITIRSIHERDGA